MLNLLVQTMARPACTTPEYSTSKGKEVVDGTTEALEDDASGPVE
jgi:hypothetical protein